MSHASIVDKQDHDGDFCDPHSPLQFPHTHTLQVWLLPEVPKALANAHPQGRVPTLMTDQEPVWPSPYLHFKQEILAHDSERY